MHTDRNTIAGCHGLTPEWPVSGVRWLNRDPPTSHNLLFGRPGADRPLTVVDTQTVGWGPAMTDLAYFSGCTLPVPVRRAHSETRGGKPATTPLCWCSARTAETRCSWR